MRTDIPLKLHAEYFPADLLGLLGDPDAQVLAVESLELPSGAARLDSLFRLRSPRGAPYLRLLEWQGYRDPGVLWRALGYQCWLILHREEHPVLVTVVYLTPEADAGDTAQQTLDDHEVQSIRINVARLWEQDAQAALATGRIGLAVLSPLMRGASSGLVEEVAALVLRQAPRERQADLLNILGVFAEPLMEPGQFVRIMGKERLMESKLLDLLVGDRVAEAEARFAAREREREAQFEARLAALDAQQASAARQAIKEAIKQMVIARFPSAPVSILSPIYEVQDVDRLQNMLLAVGKAADRESLERALADAASAQ